MRTGVKPLIEAANAVVLRVSPAQAQRMIAAGQAVVIDVRDAPEVEKPGKVAGAMHVPRDELEFRADADSPDRDRSLRHDRPVIPYRAPGGSSALNARTPGDPGCERVYGLGAFKDWGETGGRSDDPIDTGMQSRRAGLGPAS